MLRTFLTHLNQLQPATVSFSWTCRLTTSAFSLARKYDDRDERFNVYPQDKRRPTEPRFKPVRYSPHAIEQMSDDQWHLQNLDDANPPKTTVEILSLDTPKALMQIISFNEMGFRLHDERFLAGPVAVFPQIALSWQVMNHEEINEESLSLFFLLYPSPEVVIIGVESGDDIFPLKKRIAPLFSEAGIGLEVLPIDQACSTYNYLSAERRHVAAALIPPKRIQFFSKQDMQDSGFAWGGKMFEDSGIDDEHILTGVPYRQMDKIQANMAKVMRGEKTMQQIADDRNEVDRLAVEEEESRMKKRK